MNRGLYGIATLIDFARRLTTKGDLLVGSGDSSVATRLAVGTDGQQLQADSTQTLGVKWATPAADVGFANPMTTRGDVLVEGAGPVPARLAVGAANSLLKSDGTDPSWTTAPTLAGVLTAQALKASGLTGATAASRYAGATASAAPASGTFAAGDFVVSQDGHLYVCTVLGTPGTWVDAGTVSSAVSSVFTRTGAVVAASGDYTAAQVTNAADKSSASTQAFTGQASATALAATGLTGSVAASRYVGATASGAPASGAHLVGDFAITQDGHIYVCTVLGTPGTWVDAGSAGGFSSPMTTAGDLILGDTGGAAIRLAKGTDGQVLTTDATTHLPKWDTPAADVGFANPMTTQDDLLIGGAAGAAARLAKGTDGQVLTVNASTHHLDWETPASAGTGTVTSVAATVPTGFSVGGSPITGAGTLAITLDTQTAGKVLAGPLSGSAATPAFRSLQPSDNPTLALYANANYI